MTGAPLGIGQNLIMQARTPLFMGVESTGECQAEDRDRQFGAQIAAGGIVTSRRLCSGLKRAQLFDQPHQLVEIGGFHLVVRGAELTRDGDIFLHV
jgi:hypothetical protein